MIKEACNMSTFSDTFKLNEHWASYIMKCNDYSWCWAEGAYRSSKSVSNTLAFALYLEKCKDKIHLVIASTVSSARNIVEDGDGALGLKYYFANRYKQTKYKGNDAGIIKTPTGEKIVVYLGGAMESSYKAFRGWSCGSILMEEINLLHENTIKEARGRILMSKDPKIFVSHNPVSATHPIYELLDDLQSKNLVNYDHSTIDDNPALTRERKEEIKKEYDPDSIFYRQYILGERVNAEGLIYKLYDYNYLEEINPDEYISYIIVCDPGSGPSATAFECVAMRRGFKGLDVILDYHFRNDDKENRNKPKQPIDFANDLLEFTKSADEFFERAPEAIILDNGDAFYRDVKSVFNASRFRNINIKYPYKEDIPERIRQSSSLIYQGRLRFNKKCRATITSFNSVQYDPKAYLKGEIRYLDEPTLGTRVDEVDAVCYGIYFYINDLKRTNWTYQMEDNNAQKV